MDFDLSNEQRERYDRLLAAVREQLGDPDLVGDGQLTRSVWKTAAGLGLTGLCLSTQDGGLGLGALDTALALEAFGRGCPDTGVAFAVAAHLLACAVAIRDFGATDIRGPLLAGLAGGDTIAGNAMTEDGAGSDVGALAATARREGDTYVLDGEKSFASNAPIADVLVTYAVTDPGAGFLGVSAFVVPVDLPGLTVSTPLPKMGLNACPTGRVRFDSCRVPASHLLGVEGQGGAVFQHSMVWERGCLFAVYVGLMERQLEQCVAHAHRRRQFGRRIGDFQAVSHRIVDMRQRLESARLLLYRACWLLDQGRDAATNVALSKLAVSQAAVANSVDAIQIFGAAGYLTDNGIERQLRDCVPSTIFSGTSEMQRELVARGLGL
jgi:alkylation response protein AidB-like acyl-CoA dehydrogenase